MDTHRGPCGDAHASQLAEGRVATNIAGRPGRNFKLPDLGALKGRGPGPQLPMATARGPSSPPPLSCAQTAPKAASAFRNAKCLSVQRCSDCRCMSSGASRCLVPGAEKQ